MGWFVRDDLVHGFDGWLPMQAALALGFEEAAEVLVEAAPGAVGSNGHTPLHAAAAAGRSAELLLRLLAVSPA